MALSASVLAQSAFSVFMHGSMFHLVMFSVVVFLSVADLLGFTPAEIVGKSWYHFQHACDLDTALACHKTCK